MSRILELSPSIVFKVEQIPITDSSSGIERTVNLRMYIPDWGKVIYDEDFLDPFIQRSGFKGHSKFIVGLFLQCYLQNNIEPNGEFALCSLKEKKGLNLDSVEFNDFIASLMGGKYIEPDKKEKFIEKLRRDYSNEDIEARQTILKNALYREMPSTKISKTGQFELYIIYYKKIFEHYKKIAETYAPGDNLTKDDRDTLNNLLNEKDIFFELRNSFFNGIPFNDILVDIQNITEPFGEINLYKPSFDTNQILKFNDSDELVKKIIEHLSQWLEDTKGNDRKETLLDWISFCKEYFSQSKEDKIVSLIRISDMFSDKSGLVKIFNLEIEELLRVCYRSWAKKVFPTLNQSENLTKEEKRLFILTNIGSPILNFRTPIFDPILAQYINFGSTPLMLLYFSSLNKINSQTLRNIIFQFFLSFLKFYGFWSKFSREQEKENYNEEKNQKRKKSNIDIDNLYFNPTEAALPKINKSDNELPNTEKEDMEENLTDNLENDFSIAIEDNDEDLVEDFEPNENDMESVKLDLEKYRDFEVLDNTQSRDETDDWNEKMKVKKPAIRIDQIINKMFKEFYFNDIIGQYCTADEQSLLMDIYIYKMTFDEAAEVRQVSKVAINNRLKRIYKKLAQSKELNLLYGSMNE
jgi:hypothetical protein